MQNQLSVSDMVGLTWTGKDEKIVHDFLHKNGKQVNFHLDIEENIWIYKAVVERVLSCSHRHQKQQISPKTSPFLCNGHSHSDHHEHCSHSHGIKHVHSHAHNPFHTQSIANIPRTYGKTALENVIAILGENLVRGKGKI